MVLLDPVFSRLTLTLLVIPYLPCQRSGDGRPHVLGPGFFRGFTTLLVKRGSFSTPPTVLEGPKRGLRRLALWRSDLSLSCVHGIWIRIGILLPGGDF